MDILALCPKRGEQQLTYMPASVAKIIFNHFRHHAQIICGKLAQKVNFTENTLFTL